MKMIRFALTVAASVMIVSVAKAEDYEPVRCSVRQPYEGQAVHASVAVEPPAAFVDTPLDAETVARLDSAFDLIRDRTSAPAATAAVGVPGRGLWTSGGETPLFWASAGKTFTAVVVLQLVQEG